jgi:hypothetical protein
MRVSSFVAVAVVALLSGCFLSDDPPITDRAQAVGSARIEVDRIGTTTETTCARGCSSRTGYQLVCPTDPSMPTGWCPASNSCGEMDTCQAEQRAACDAACAGGCVAIANGPESCCDCPAEEVGCDGVVGSRLTYDACGVCGGDGRSCEEVGCDGVAGSRLTYDACGVCGGDGRSCEEVGCDGVAGSRLTYDACGVCGGDGTTCGELGCDGVLGSGLTYDACGVCGGDGRSCEEIGCDGTLGSGLIYDACGVCGGDGSSCEVIGCDGVLGSGLVYDACDVCGGDGTTCAGCDDVIGSGLTYDGCGVCGGDGSSCAGCDGTAWSGLVLDACGVCGGDGSSCVGCDGVAGSGLELDECGECGGDGGPCGPPPPPAKEYVMSIYFVPADGADGAASLLSNAAYATPRALLAALAQSTALGEAHTAQGLVHLPHSIGHAYVSFFTRNADGTGAVTAAGYPTGQTGGGGAGDVVDVGAGGTILRIQPGWMNTVAEAQKDIDLRSKNHGTPVFVRGIRVEAAAQLIGRADFILSEATWKAVQDRVTLHKRGAAFRYGLMLEPAIKSRQTGETGGEGAGCTSFAAMAVTFSGALPRVTVNPPWTRTITFGERTIGRGDYNWGSHIQPPWIPGVNIRDKAGGLPAASYLSAWTFPGGIDWDERLFGLTIPGREFRTAQRTITGYWYDPDLMYYWLRAVYNRARIAPGATTVDLGVTWTAKSTTSPDVLGGYPYIEVDARGAKPKALWDTKTNPYDTNWDDAP